MLGPPGLAPSRELPRFVCPGLIGTGRLKLVVQQLHASPPFSAHQGGRVPDPKGGQGPGLAWSEIAGPAWVCQSLNHTQLCKGLHVSESHLAASALCMPAVTWLWSAYTSLGLDAFGCFCLPVPAWFCMVSSGVFKEGATGRQGVALVLGEGLLGTGSCTHLVVSWVALSARAR